MFLIYALSVLVSVGALGWLLVMGSRLRTVWFRGLAIVLAVIAVQQILAILTYQAQVPGGASGVAFQLVGSLLLSAGALASVAVVSVIRSSTGLVADAAPAENVYLEQLFNNSPEAIALISNDDHVIRINEAFTRVFGYTEDETVGQTIDALIVPRDLIGEHHAHVGEVAAGRSIRDRTTRRHKSGELLEVSFVTAPVMGHDGQLAAFGIYHDLTEQERTVRLRRQLEKAVETMQIGVTITDLSGKILYVNPAEAHMHGWAAEELIGKSASIFAPSGERRPMTADQIREMRSWQREVANVRSDGTTLPVSLLSDVVRDEDGEPVAMVTTSEDITVRVAAEKQLRDSEERYALAARGAQDGLWDWDLTNDALYLSPRWKEMLGYRDGEVGSRSDDWFGRVHAEDRDALDTEIRNHIEGFSSQLSSEHRIRRRDGEYCWVSCRGLVVTDETGKPARMAGSMSDITERKGAEQQLFHDAFHDALTGLPNRALFTNLLKRSIGHAKRSELRRYAVLFIDLDRFKVLNDSLGHSYGDRLLVALGARLEGCLRPGDTVARLGGDEFIILLDDIIEASDATRVADRVKHALEAPLNLGEHEVFTSASIGIALGSASYEEPDDVIRDADLAMYRAKSHGKGRYEMFDKEMHLNAVALLQLETDLRRAMDRGELLVHYQPIVMIETKTISCFEALVRWQHPVRGLLNPGVFIPLAEETGIIVRLGRWVLEHACRQIVEWQQKFPSDPPLTVSVNVSPKEINQPDFVENVFETLKTTGLSPDSLKLEVTEGVLMESAERSVAVLRRLADAGIRVLIDDFGTGYSSLSYLHRFSVDTLKIDRSFVEALAGAEENVEIIRTIITLARALGMTVIAEGVETEDQHRRLKELDCEEVQGFLFSKAVDVRTAEELLVQSR